MHSMKEISTSQNRIILTTNAFEQFSNRSYKAPDTELD